MPTWPAGWSRGQGALGIVIGGSGQGEAIAANKVHGSRAALCHDEYTARFARRHNDANVLSLGARVVATELALDIVDVFLATGFDGGRHVARIEELSAIEAEESACGPRPSRCTAWWEARPGGRIRYSAEAVVPV